MDTAYFRFKICFLLLLIFIQPGRLFTAKAQLPGMRKYTLIDGYTATNGYVIQQDRKGFLWLGTENGALRFDGKRFQALRDKLMPADQEILSCYPYGKDQVLLVPLLNNITYYKDGEVISGRKDPGLNLVLNTGQNSCFYDRYTRSMWLSDASTLKNLYCFSADGIKRINIPDDGSYVIAVRKDRIICFKNSERVLRQYDLKEQRYQPIYDEYTKPFSFNGFIETKEDGKYIFAHDFSGQKISIYNFRNDSTLHLVKTVPRPSASKNPVVYTDKELNMWFKFSDGGITYLDKKQNPPFHFMEKTAINFLFVDKEKNLWMSAQNNSLYFLSSKHFQNALRVNAVLPGTAIPKCVNGDEEGNIAIGYVNEKLFSIKKNGQTTHYPLNQNFYEGVRCICPLGNSRFLIMDKDLALVDAKKNSIRYFDNKSTYKDMFLYADKGLLVATQSKAFFIEAKDLVSGNFSNNHEVIFNGRTSSIASLPDSTVLIGTPDGLFIKRNLSAKAVRINHPELSHINITDIVTKGKNGALVSTNAQGIYYFNSLSGTAKAVKVYPIENGGLVRRIFKQNDSLYWLATEKGASEVQFNSEFNIKHVRNYTFYDGLPSNNITDVYVYRDTAFITTAEGPGIIPLLDTGLLHMSKPLVYLNTVRLRDSLIYQPKNGIELSHLQHDLMISLSAISYESFGNTRYYYKMEGLSDEWTETDNPEIHFTGLPPGNYLFQAYASNAKGNRSNKPVSLNIRVLPALWQTLSFKVIIGVTAAFLLYFVIRRRTARLALSKYEKARQKRRLAELELEAIKAQINPHFIYNCLNSIQYFYYEKQHDLARKYLDLFARLIRFTMQYSRQAFITVADETSYLRNYLQLEKMRFHDRLHYQIIVADHVDQQVKIPAMIIQPYVENALKHGIAARKDGGNVIVFFDQPAEDLITISVEDDGLGFNEKQNSNKSSLGLRLSSSRAETYNQLFGMKIQINIYNKKDTTPGKSGIIVQLNIPIISYEHSLL